MSYLTDKISPSIFVKLERRKNPRKYIKYSNKKKTLQNPKIYKNKHHSHFAIILQLLLIFLLIHNIINLTTYLPKNKISNCKNNNIFMLISNKGLKGYYKFICRCILAKPVRVQNSKNYGHKLIFNILNQICILLLIIQLAYTYVKLTRSMLDYIIKRIFVNSVLYPKKLCRNLYNKFLVLISNKGLKGYYKIIFRCNISVHQRIYITQPCVINFIMQNTCIRLLKRSHFLIIALTKRTASFYYKNHLRQW